MKNKEEECEELEEEGVALRVEVDKLKRNLKRSQVLDDILSCQISPCDKKSLGYIGKYPCKEDSFENKVGILQKSNHSES